MSSPVRLPLVFAALTFSDWIRAARFADQLPRDRVESVAFSLGYLDVGIAADGRAYLGAVSAGWDDPRVIYRILPWSVWQRAADAAAAREGAAPLPLGPLLRKRPRGVL